MAKKWVCPVCGYVYEGENPPEKCPQCKVPGEKFKLKEETEGLSFACEHELGVAKEVQITGGGGVMTIKDGFGGHTVTVNANDASKISNKMARDYWFDREAMKATKIVTSSFCAVHEISEPLCDNSMGKYASRRAK